MTNKGTLKVCDKGHKFYKSSDCPVCPYCEAERAPKEGFMATLAAPARRALENAGITSVQLLAQHTEKEILKLHGMGKASLPRLRLALKDEGLAFRKD